MNVLVTGGAGYVGSHAVKGLVERGGKVTVVDDLRRGHRQAVRGAKLEVGNVADGKWLGEVMAREKVQCVWHFAALAYVGESVKEPGSYYENNVGGALGVLAAMRMAGVNRLVFSSTCAVYGEPKQVPINESAACQPVNPYGWSKRMVEQMLLDEAAARPEFGAVALRYFNVAGCAADGSLGEDHRPESHLIPLLLETALGQHAQLTVFGNNYDTPDGTCIRDYLHVEDLVAAHHLAGESMEPGRVAFYNLGIGRGYSVLEVVAAARQVTGHSLPLQFGPRRPGDPPALFADSTLIQQTLGWRPQYVDLPTIIEKSLPWKRKHPQGYA